MENLPVVSLIGNSCTGHMSTITIPDCLYSDECDVRNKTGMLVWFKLSHSNSEPVKLPSLHASHNKHAA